MKHSSLSLSLSPSLSTSHSHTLPYSLLPLSRGPAMLLRSGILPSSPSIPRLTHILAAAKPKVLVISGPTGAGKSKLALHLAAHLSGEIISADSVQIYRGLDVGSAKSPLTDRHQIPHHLLDILDPSQDYSVGQFFQHSRSATADVIRRGAVPLVVGGTGLYLRWYIYGKPPVPVSSQEISAESTAEILPFQQFSRWDDAVDLVVKSGDTNARFLPRNDWYRLRRSLEIIKSSGSPPSSFPLPSSINSESDLDYEFLCFFLSSPRLNLYRSIDLRCEEMVADERGILAEASWMLDNGLLPNMNSATRAIGYRQAMEFLLHCRELDGECSEEDLFLFLEDFQKASRNFVKRQLTWFRSERIYQWVDASRPMEEVVGYILEAFHGGGNRRMPEALRMGKRAPGRQESLELKAYRPRKNILGDKSECSRVLEWIRRTQKKK